MSNRDATASPMRSKPSTKDHAKAAKYIKEHGVSSVPKLGEPRAQHKARLISTFSHALPLASLLQVEELLAEALQAAVNTDSKDPIGFIGDYMSKRSKSDGEGGSADAAAYVKTGILGVAGERMLWLVFFLFGLLLCANVMHGFEAVRRTQSHTPHVWPSSRVQSPPAARVFF